MNKLSCEKCEFIKYCKQEFGEEYEAVIGTHFCRGSWKEYKCCCEKEKENI